MENTAKTGWHNATAKVANDMLAQQCGITLVDFVNIEEFMNNRGQATNKDTAEIELANVEEVIEETDGSEDDADDNSEVFNLLPDIDADDNDDDELIDPPEIIKFASLKIYGNDTVKIIVTSRSENFLYGYADCDSYLGAFGINIHNNVETLGFFREGKLLEIRADEEISQLPAEKKYKFTRENFWRNLHATTDQALFLADKIARESKPSVEELPTFMPAEDNDADDELIDDAESFAAIVNKICTFKTEKVYPLAERLIKLTFAVNVCFHFYLNKLKSELFDKHVYKTIDEGRELDKELHEPWHKIACMHIDCKTYKMAESLLKECQNVTYYGYAHFRKITSEIVEQIQTKLGDKVLADELKKITDELGIDRALLKQSGDSSFDPAIFDDPPTVIETPTPDIESEQQDEFRTELAKLKAAVNEKQIALIKAQEARKQATNLLKIFLDNTALKLKQRLDAVELDYTITLKKSNGASYHVVDFSEIYISAYLIGCDVEFHFENWKGKTLARYDTPAQVETVISRLKAAIERGDKEFTFPTAEKLDIEVSLARAMKIAMKKYQGYCRARDLTAAARELQLYDICRRAMRDLYKEAA